MMKRLTCHLIIVTIAILPTLIAEAQVGSNATRHHEKDGLSFDYPAAWKLTDNSTESAHTVTVAPEGSANRIVISVNVGPVLSCDFQTESKKITDALTKTVAMRIKAGAAPRTSSATTRIGATDVNGTELQGVINHKPAMGQIYSVRLNRRFVSLVYVRVNNDERASSAWDTVRTTLRVEPAVGTVMGTTAPGGSEAAITSGVLNGRAVVLPRPKYPAIAAAAHADGTVTVQVTIDESGNVISANAIEGHPLLRGVSVAAARDARFSPTKLCNEPVRVAGVIIYNFVAQ